MKKTIISGLGILLCAAPLFAQTTIDLQNTRDGESVEYCITHKKHVELLANPAAVASFAQDEIIRQQEQQNQNSPEGLIYYIPVVFHVLHNGGIENISDEQILDALNILNRDYSLQNADANNVASTFQGLPANVEIQFRLATIAPGNNYSQCFKGITRTQNALTNDGSSGTAQVNAIIAGNDVYNGQFPGDKYLNIFICADIGGAAGYTYKPSNFIGTNMNNGIWVLHNYVGSIGTSTTYTSRTLTHEVGHWLNLDHTWGGNNNPGNSSSCSSDDGVSDTPNTIGVTSCNLNENSCGPIANVENYMDYSYCSKMFTPGQVTRMRNAINSNIANRDNVISASNLQLVGATGAVTLCKADFAADRTTICVGDQITFDDQSYNAVSSWSWNFTGGTPATSTAQNPTVTYSTPGIYTVTLLASDGSASDTETKTSYIRVLPAGSGLPFLDGFETYTTFNGINEWEVYNPVGNGFEVYNGAGHTGVKSARLLNFGQSAGQTDELISAPVDLSTVPTTGSVTLSFRYAYRKKTTATDEWLKVFITKDCGENWAQRKTIHGTALSSLTSSSSWTPSAQTDWVTVHMTNVTSDYFVENFRYKFEFESDAGNNFFLDDINIYTGGPSDDLVAGISEEGLLIEGLSVYPNPADEELNVQFDALTASDASVTVVDLTGKALMTTVVKANTGTNLVMMNTSSLASGTYFARVNLGGTQQVVQFVVK